jgi:hypothetical protein
MQYKVILSYTSEGGYEVSAPLMPHWRISAQTRAEGIAKARKAIVDFISRSEVISVEIPTVQASGQANDVPWEWFGSGQDDPSWAQLFDAIEENRDATRFADSATE